MKWLGWGALLAAVLSIFFRDRSTDKGELENAQERAYTAEAEAAKAKSTLERERIRRETEKELAAAAALSDDDILADALAKYRAGRSRRESGGTD